MPFRPHRHTTLAAITALAFALAFALAGITSTAKAATPGATTLVADHIGATTLTLTWQIADQHTPVTLGWQDETSPKGSSTWEGHYPAGTTRTTLTGLTPAHRYWVYVTLDGPGYVPTSATFTTQATPPAAAPARATTPPAAAGCARQDRPTTTTATWTRINPRTLRAVATVHGRTGATTPPVVAIQRYTGRTWVDVARGKSGTPQTITQTRGTFRAAFVGDCKLPALPSVSTAVTR